MSEQFLAYGSSIVQKLYEETKAGNIVWSSSDDISPFNFMLGDVKIVLTYWYAGPHDGSETINLYAIDPETDKPEDRSRVAVARGHVYCGGDHEFEGVLDKIYPNLHPELHELWILVRELRDAGVRTFEDLMMEKVRKELWR